MHHVKWLFNSINYGFYCFYSFTLIDVVKKLVFGDFALSNATNFAQFLLTVIGVFFAYYKLKTYIRDSITRSKILEEELFQKQNDNFTKKWDSQFITPFKDKENDNK